MRLLLALVALLLPCTAFAQGMVTAADPRAAEAGREILRQGGSATDAAMAMMLALTVVEPQSSGIGGGGFLLHHDGRTGALETIDGRETAPAAARADRFLGADGRPMPFLQAVAGGRSVGVPGNIRLMAMATKKWGRLPWRALFAPAIRLAEQGYRATPPLVTMIERVRPAWRQFPETAALYTPGGAVPAVGQTIRNPALAATLRRLARGGPDAFYRGANARALVAAASGSRLAPSDITLADLAAYRAKARPPVCGAYRGYRVCGMGPPSSGATTVLQILGMLERFDLKRLGRESPVAWHLIGEAMRLAYADRDLYLGDADFVPVPVAGLIDPAYVASRSALIGEARALGRYQPGTPPGAAPRTAVLAREVPSTTHFIAIDGAGDVATMTSTVEGPFGSQILAGGYVLNNELTDFSLAPERDGAPVANRVEPGKRPLSSMSPTIVYDPQGRPVFTVGAAGGRTIIMQVTKAIIAHLDWGLSPRDAIAEPQLYFDAAGLVVEKGSRLEAMIPALERMGHRVSTAVLPLKANAAARTAEGWIGGADARSVGIALAQ